jgi:Ca-activated chloride channel homolog
MELPMEYAFQSGKTNIFAGLETAFKISRPWRPGSTTVLLLSDGDTVPASGMPRRPASVANVLVVGVGDTRSGRFIDGRQSRQDASTLRQVAARLHGHYHNANEKHISTSILKEITQESESNPLKKLTRREYALLASAIGSLLLAGLPLLLHRLGTGYVPGVLRAAADGVLPPARLEARPDAESGRPAETSGVR